MTSRLIAKLTMSTCLSAGVLYGAMINPAAAINTHVVNDPQGTPFIQLRFFDVGDGVFGFGDESEWDLSDLYKNQIIDATGYWAEVIKLVPGNNPAIINVGALIGGTGAAAGSHAATMLDGSPTTVQAALTNQYYTNLTNGAHGAIVVYNKVGTEDWSQAPYTPSHIALTAETSLGTVLIHEIGHALGVLSNAFSWEDQNNRLAAFSADDFGPGFDVWSTHLRDDNDNFASAGQFINCKGCYVPDGEDAFDVRKDQAYFTGTHVSEVLNGAMKGLPMRVATDYGPYDAPFFSHIELKNSLMSHQLYRNYSTLMEAELAALQDIGYTIDRRNFYGHSVYGDGLTIINNNPYFGRNADGTAYTDNTYNTAALGLGLHVYGSHNTITQNADLLSVGAGGGGIRIDGAANNLIVAPDVQVHANGANGRGIMFAYGKDHTLTHRGDVQAMGHDGIAVSFDFGHNSRGDGTGYRGSYILELDDRVEDQRATIFEELNGALVSTFDLTGRVAGKKAAIFMSENALVGQINVMQGASITGDIISEYAKADDNGNLRLTELSFGLKPDGNGNSTGAADADFRLAYDGNITGKNISLHLDGGTTLLTGDHQVFDVDVAQAAMLSGQGIYQIDATQQFRNSGILNPSVAGAAITINGNYIQSNSGTLQLAFNDQRDIASLVVKGGADLNGTISFAPDRGYYRDGFSLTSDQWLQPDTKKGYFAGVTTSLNSPTLTATATHDGDLAYTVALSRDADAYSQYAGTSEDREVGAALDSLAINAAAELKPLITALDFSAPDGSTIRSSLPQLSGEAYASASGVLLNASGITRSSINNRLSQAFGGTPVNPVSVMAYGPKAKASQAGNAIDHVAPVNTADLQRYAAWGAAFGSWATQSATDNAARTKSTIGGFITGIDGDVYDSWRLGLMAGYSRSTFKTPSLSSSGSSDNYTFGAYAGTEWATAQGALGFRSGLSYSWHNIEMSRSVAFNGYSDKLSADYHGGTFQVFGELGYTHDLSPRSIIEPYANLAYVHVKTDSFTEKGHNGTALSVQSGAMDTTLSTLGMRLSTGFELGNIQTTARADLGWRHAFGDVIPSSTASFAAGSNAFTTSGSPIGKDTALIEAGLDFAITKNSKLGVSYQGQFGSGITQNGVNANFSVKF
ncbi:autotransporter outer membrane beta-barrel domain-containing protein [Paenochrobactrum sp. BZR 588]|jgi:subtilase-type serine protease|uniref:autotransporter family protein n=1 Tax=unclassified Paenochrobactrum TaxID=2639760 RepID=UPI003853E2D8